MSENSYFVERNNDTLEKIRVLRRELPQSVSEFIVGIETRTTPLTRLNYCYDLKIFFSYLISENDFFGDKKLRNITIEDISKITSTDIELFLEYLSHYKLNGKVYNNSLKTKARKLASVRSYFKYLFNKNYLISDVASKVATPKLHEKAIIRLDSDEVNDILEVADTGDMLSTKQLTFHDKTRSRDLAILTLFLGTGIRISELVGININDINFDKNSFRITRKGGNQSILYFSDEIKTPLVTYYKERMRDDSIPNDEEAFFLSLQRRRISVRAVELLVKKYASIVSPLKPITPHKLRSTFGTNLYQCTKDIYVVAEVLGHRDVNTTKRHYAAMSEDIKREASTKITLHSDDK